MPGDLQPTLSTVPGAPYLFLGPRNCHQFSYWDRNHRNMKNPGNPSPLSLSYRYAEQDLEVTPHVSNSTSSLGLLLGTHPLQISFCGFPCPFCSQRPF